MQFYLILSVEKNFYWIKKCRVKLRMSVASLLSIFHTFAYSWNVVNENFDMTYESTGVGFLAIGPCTSFKR